MVENVAIGLVILTVVAVLGMWIFTRVYRLTARALTVDFDRALLEVDAAVGEVATPDEGRSLTWQELEQGKFQDTDLRKVVDALSHRLRRVESGTRVVEKRRQALLETYHKQGLSQSRISFWFSLILGILGFAVIVFAVLSKNEQAGTYIAGAVTEAVAGLFFTQSNQSRKLMAEFFDKLRDDRRLEESLVLTEAIEDTRLKSSLQALLAMQLINSTVPPSVLPGFYPDRDTPSQPPTTTP
jgi:hypothetical protein